MNIKEPKIRTFYRPDKHGKKFQTIQMSGIVIPTRLFTVRDKKAYAIRSIKALEKKYSGFYVPIADLNDLLGTSIRWGRTYTPHTDRLPGVTSIHLRTETNRGLTKGLKRCLLIDKHLVKYIANLDHLLGMYQKPYVKKRDRIPLKAEPSLFEPELSFGEVTALRSATPPERTSENTTKDVATENLKENDMAHKTEKKNDPAVSLLLERDISTLFGDTKRIKSKLGDISNQLSTANSSLEILSSKIDTIIRLSHKGNDLMTGLTLDTGRQDLSENPEKINGPSSEDLMKILAKLAG